MGRITVFVKDNCKFCDIILAVLRRAIPEVLRQIAAFSETEYGVEGIDLVIINVTHDFARASQCKVLSKQQTVPQIFFNDEHVGNCKQTQTVHNSGILHTKLYLLAYQASTNFPPPPEAAIVKITKDIACASQPAPHQLSTIARSGVKSVLSLVHESEPCYNPADEETFKGLGVQFARAPPRHAPNMPVGVVAASASAWLKMASPTLTAVACGRDEANISHLTIGSSALHHKDSSDKDDKITVGTFHSDSDMSASDDGMSLRSWGSASSGFPASRGRGAAQRPRIPEAFRPTEPATQGHSALPPRPRKSQRPPCAVLAMKRLWEVCGWKGPSDGCQWHQPERLHALAEVAETGAEYGDLRASDTGAEKDADCSPDAAPSSPGCDPCPAQSAEDSPQGRHVAMSSTATNDAHHMAVSPPRMSGVSRRTSVTSAVSGISDDYGLSDDDVHSFDARDDDVGGRDPLDVVFTKEWFRSVSSAVHKWAKNLGYDLEAHADLAELVDFVLHTPPSSVGRPHGTAP